MRKVVLESPYAGATQTEIDANVVYARACLRHSLMMGEAPVASHLLYTQPGVLDDNIAAERQMGIEAGLAWGPFAEATVVYCNRGMSKGMEYGIRRAQDEGRKVVTRILTPEYYKETPMRAGTAIWPPGCENFLPMGETHHDAVSCPKCSPKSVIKQQNREIEQLRGEINRLQHRLAASGGR